MRKKNHFKNILTISFLILVAAAGSAAAATFTVTNTNESGAGSLRQAITDANTAAGDDIVAFDASFNVPRTITLAGDPLLVLGNGALTINGPGRNLLTVSANNLNRVFEVNSVATPTAANVVFNGLTITGGNASGGGGIVINPGVSSPDVREAVVTVNGVTITNNNAGNGAGGGISCLRNGTVNVFNSILSNNRANIGGGINIGSGIGTCLLNINGSEITRNTNQGLVCCGNAGNIDVQINITNSTFSYNFGGNGNGSAIRFGSNNLTTRRITNSTFFGNQGAAAIQVEFNNLILENVTIAGNYFDHPTTTAGLFLVGVVTATSRNSLIANNFNNSGGNDLVVQTNSTLTSQGYNLIENIGEGNGISGNTTGNLIGVDPLLDRALRFNGGATPTLALRAGSPAIDAGDPTTFQPTDQRGVTRPQDGDGNGVARSDIGATEKRLTDQVSTAFDFDNDGRADLSVFRPSNNVWYLQRSQFGFTGIQFGLSGDLIQPADYDADGITDLAVFRPSNGTWYIQRSSLGFTGIQFGASGDIPVPADFDSDGRADLAVFRPSIGTWYIQRSTLGFTGIQFGASGDKPVPADYDGDGRDDLAVFRSNIWYIQRSTLGFTGIQFGQAGDLPVQADYDADGKTDLAVFRSGIWYLQQSQLGFTGIQFGQTGDLPVPADYDGDGKADVSVFRNGIWYLNRSTAGFTGIQFGAGGDKPIPNAFVQ